MAVSGDHGTTVGIGQVDDPREGGPPSVYTCPECHGTLWELADGALKHYRCRVGHSYSPEALFIGQTEALEAAMWAALRALEERQQLARQLLAESERAGRGGSAAHYRRRNEEAERSAEIIRSVLNVGLRGNTTEASISPEDASGA